MPDNDSVVRPAAATWPLIVGAVFLGLTVVFLMGLILLSTAGHGVPCSSRFLVVALLALTVSIGGSFLGGTAAAKGQIPWKSAQTHPIRFAVTGGIAVFVITLVLGSQLYDGGRDCVDAPSAARTTVRGRVVGSDGTPIGAALVNVPGGNALMTDGDGVFELAVDGRSLGAPFSLSINANGYAQLTKSFELNGTDVELGDLSLVRPN